MSEDNDVDVGGKAANGTSSRAVVVESVEIESVDIDKTPADVIEEPAKLLRIASMTRSMLEEARQAPLDEDGRSRLRDIYEASVDQLRSVLTEDLREELSEVFLPLDDDVPTQAELRIAQAQLIGWLEGLFNGIQAAIMTQQMAAQAQLQQLRTRRPNPEEGDESGGGLYL